jgi:protein-S-isoprenylcysteine O-methyltransferase Ste14
MSVIAGYLLAAMWVGYLAYWQVMAKDVKVSEREEAGTSRLVRLVLLLLAAALLMLPRVPVAPLDRRFLPAGAMWVWIGAAVTGIGLAFSIWARRHLGTNWSQSVTVKKDHELITSGPYGMVRHPIYTGLLTGFLGSAMARGEWRGLMAVVLVGVALWRKLQMEEKWMVLEFGDAYRSYARQVRRLVPYVF